MARTALMTSQHDPESSVDLLRKMQSGDEQAENDLLARYIPRLERWASGRLPLGVRSMLDTGDLVQDAVINALPKINRLEVRTEKALEVYLKRAIKNRIIDIYRRPRRNREEVKDDLPDRSPSPMDLVVGDEARERFERALDALKETDRQLIVMRVELGFDNDQIAAELNKSAAAARMALTRALTRLAAEMQRSR